MTQKDELVGWRRANYAGAGTAYGLEVRPGQARLRNADALVIDGQVLEADAYLVATGFEPADADLPGLGTRSGT